MLSCCILSIAVCTDTFFAAMGCAASGIQIRKRYSILISLTGTLILAVSLAGSAFLSSLLPPLLLRAGGSLLLAVMGISQILRNGFASLFKNGRQICLHFKDLALMIQICLDETKADADGSKTLNFRETCLFSIALSLDSIVTGLGAGLTPVQFLPCLLLCFSLGILSVLLGCRLGQLSRKKLGLSWIGGVFLLLLALMRLLL